VLPHPQPWEPVDILGKKCTMSQQISPKKIILDAISSETDTLFRAEYKTGENSFNEEKSLTLTFLSNEMQRFFEDEMHDKFRTW
jgi:hypothetical protein